MTPNHTARVTKHSMSAGAEERRAHGTQNTADPQISLTQKSTHRSLKCWRLLEEDRDKTLQDTGTGFSQHMQQSQELLGWSTNKLSLRPAEETITTVKKPRNERKSLPTLCQTGEQTIYLEYIKNCKK